MSADGDGGATTAGTTIDLKHFNSSDSSGFVTQGSSVNGGVGYSVAGAGDVNGDGYEDVIIGAFGVDTLTDAGEAYVVFGKASGFQTINLVDFNSSDSSGFIIQGEDAGYQLGQSVSSAGDMNGDGFADVLVGAPSADPAGMQNAGEVYVIFGKPSGYSTVYMSNFVSSDSTGFKVYGAAADDALGGSVASAGDVNGDGWCDIIIGANGADSDSGRAYVLFGKPSGFTAVNLTHFVSSNIHGFVIMAPTDTTNAELGQSVSSAGDVNGDGFADVLVGAPSADPAGMQNAGEVYVIFGKPTGYAEMHMESFSSADSTGFIVRGANNSGMLGGAVSAAGDVNGDGYSDVIVGAWGTAPNGLSAAGEAFVLFGRPSGFRAVNISSFQTSDSVGFAIYGGSVNAELGHAVSGAGDVNADGFDDVLVSARYASPDGRRNAGEAYLLLGKSSGFVSVNMADFTPSDAFGLVIQGAAASDVCGQSVAGAGDVNGDGFDDVLIGVYLSDPNGVHNAGSAFVLLSHPADGDSVTTGASHGESGIGIVVLMAVCVLFCTVGSALWWWWRRERRRQVYALADSTGAPAVETPTDGLVEKVFPLTYNVLQVDYVE